MLGAGGQSMWEEVKRQFPVGSVVTGTVTLHQPFGVFVDLGDPDCYGLVEIPEFLDAGRMTVDQYPPVGSTVRAVVMHHGDEDHRVWLTMRPSRLGNPNRVAEELRGKVYPP